VKPCGVLDVPHETTRANMGSKREARNDEVDISAEGSTCAANGTACWEKSPFFAAFQRDRSGRPTVSVRETDFLSDDSPLLRAADLPNDCRDHQRDKSKAQADPDDHWRGDRDSNPASTDSEDAAKDHQLGTEPNELGTRGIRLGRDRCHANRGTHQKRLAA
jgi:hypothetical protein